MEERLGRSVKSLADGALGGATSLASPTPTLPVGAPVPATLAPEASGDGREFILAYWQDNEVGAPTVGNPFEFEYVIHSNPTPTNIAWSQTVRDEIELIGDGIFVVWARVVHTGTPATFLSFPIKRDNFQVAVASAVGGGISVGSGVDVGEPSGGSNGPIRLYHDSGGVTPTEAQLTVEFIPGGFTFQGS